MQGHKYAGVTLDWYDDKGSTLKQKFPTLDKVPDIIKEANVQPKEKMANEDFALIMIDQGHVFRKFACADAGTTAMSVIYFMEHGDKLPEDAQKTAATNLLSACLIHGIVPPSALIKTADWKIPALGAGIGALGGALTAGEGNRGQGALLGAGMGAGGAALAKELVGEHIIRQLLERLGELSPQEIAEAARSQTRVAGGIGGAAGGLAGGHLLRNLTSDEESQKISMDKSAISLKTLAKPALQKIMPEAATSALGRTQSSKVMGSTLRTMKKNPTLMTRPSAAIKADTLMEQAKLRGRAAKGEMQRVFDIASAHPAGSFGNLVQSEKALAGGKTVLSSVVDVTGKKPKPIIKMAQPSDPNDYAVVMPDGSHHYPIHTWDMVKKAEDYFLENRVRFQPEIRRQFATKLAGKAVVLGYPLEGSIAVLGSKTYGKDNELQDAIDMRKVACDPRSGAREFLDELFEKRSTIHPEVYAECLKRFDVGEGLDRGWDHVVPDPWSSTFGIKTAGYEVIWADGADRVTRDALENLACNRLDLVVKEFTYDVAKEFKKDPIGIFESMPAPHKRILARMADNAESDGGSEAGTNQPPFDKKASGPVELQDKEAGWVTQTLNPREIEQLGAQMRQLTGKVVPKKPTSSVMQDVMRFKKTQPAIIPALQKAPAKL